MKPKVLILLLAALSFCACSDDPIEPAADVALGSRGVVSSANASSSNPNLISDWENQQTITLNTITFGATANKVEAPWASSSSTSLNSDFCHDIRKTDGWMMLFHTFKAIGEDVNLNYMCFYNMFTGYLKVFYYNYDESKSSNLNWVLEVSD